MRKRILAVGEILWDLLPDGPKLGGAPFNFAYRVNSLGEQGSIASRLGNDALGQTAFEGMARLGMDAALVQTDPAHPTGTVPVTLDARGNPDFTIVPNVAYDYLEATPELLRVAGEADCICFGTLIQRAPKARETLHLLLDGSPNSLKLLDLNLRRDCYTPEAIADSLARADILKLNEQEAAFLSTHYNLRPELGELAADLLTRWELKVVVVTLGEHGVIAREQGGDAVHVPGFRVQVADTCGSGDAFTAGFLHAWMHGWPLVESCQLGTALGALVAAQPGATGVVERPALNALLQTASAPMVLPGPTSS